MRNPVPSEDRIAEFSLQEDSEANNTVKVASVVCVLSPGAAQADCHIVLDRQDGDMITVLLGVEESTSRSFSTDSFADSGEKSCSCKRKREKKRQWRHAVFFRFYVGSKGTAG